MENLQNKTATLFLPSLPQEQSKQSPLKSLDPLEEDFDFDHWARVVKKQMIASLNASLLLALDEEFPNN
ncbi:hypothetical protein [Crocosphaera sp. XPORK-15E]|uniref:hypothetical protein n=1 Tax=Crocosphaera sp. XPORK-15E TaxID=3110247 RepID=UPI002B2001C1|nr:hypothetical protein [Crocosphaera sp. XPORK-15E]MEA5536622.1 hypothetical protein [Crocosphaera sp. XPORK-15E]